jgi:hypothetical protein
MSDLLRACYSGAMQRRIRESRINKISDLSPAIHAFRYDDPCNETERECRFNRR